MACSVCEYSGWVMVLHGSALRMIADNWLDGLPKYWWMRLPPGSIKAVVCSCLNDPEAAAFRHKTIVYNPLRTCRFDRENDGLILDFVNRRLEEMGTVSASIDDWQPPAGATYQGGAW